MAQNELWKSSPTVYEPNVVSKKFCCQCLPYPSSQLFTIKATEINNFGRNLEIFLKMYLNIIGRSRWLPLCWIPLRFFLCEYLVDTFKTSDGILSQWYYFFVVEGHSYFNFSSLSSTVNFYQLRVGLFFVRLIFLGNDISNKINYMSTTKYKNDESILPKY